MKLAVFHARLRLTPALSILIYRWPLRHRCRGYARKMSCFSFVYTIDKWKRSKMKKGRYVFGIRNQYSRRSRSWLTLRIRGPEKRTARYWHDLQSYAITRSSDSWWSSCCCRIWFTFLASFELNAPSVCIYPIFLCDLTFFSSRLYLSRIELIIALRGCFKRYQRLKHRASF